MQRRFGAFQKRSDDQADVGAVLADFKAADDMIERVSVDTAADYLAAYFLQVDQTTTNTQSARQRSQVMERRLGGHSQRPVRSSRGFCQPLQADGTNRPRTTTQTRPDAHKIHEQMSRVTKDIRRARKGLAARDRHGPE